MQRLFMVLILLGSLVPIQEMRAADSVPVAAAPVGKIVKVLPLLLDLKGNDALSPSLFDRDAYQAYLRNHTNEISAIRYDVLWRASGTAGNVVKIKVELKAVGPDGSPRLKTLEAAVTPGRFRHWSELPLAGGEYLQLGHVVAWRATLWSGDQLLSTQQSFLW
jgi:hypothetical protein